MLRWYAARMKIRALAPVFLLLLPSVGHADDAPEISRSAGKAGGLVVLWTRVIPKSDDARIRGLARSLQERVQRLATRVVPSLAQDVRPEPERVCPRDGCLAPTVGTLLVHDGDNCVVVALVSDKGKAPARLVPWGGKVRLKAETVPFREAPEAKIGVDDFVPCGQLLTSLNEHEADVTRALQNLTPAPAAAAVPGPAPTAPPAAPAK